jgi:hypothetical protein
MLEKTLSQLQALKLRQQAGFVEASQSFVSYTVSVPARSVPLTVVQQEETADEPADDATFVPLDDIKGDDPLLDEPVLSSGTGSGGASGILSITSSGVDKCAICHEAKDASDPDLQQLKCDPHHNFHSACFRQWVGVCREQKVPITCPLCRVDVKFARGRPASQGPFALADA